MSDYGGIDSVKHQHNVMPFISEKEREGLLSDEQFDLLVELSSIHSRKIIMAMRDHLVIGDPRKVVCERHRVNSGYLSVCIGRLSRLEKCVSKLARFYL